jgi:tetratricopeptide (TPR) repeat protein
MQRSVAEKVRLVALAAGVVAMVSAAGVARADDAAERAKRHNAQAKKLFNLGMFHEAAAEYKKAYQAKPVPDLLYNLAQCYMRLKTVKDLEQAVFYLESYQKNAPFSPIGGHVERELARIKKELEAMKKPPPPTPFYKTWWFWTAIGVAVTGATVATTVVATQPDDPVMGTADPGIFRLP